MSIQRTSTSNAPKLPDVLEPPDPAAPGERMLEMATADEVIHWLNEHLSWQAKKIVELEDQLEKAHRAIESYRKTITGFELHRGTR